MVIKKDLLIRINCSNWSYNTCKVWKIHCNRCSNWPNNDLVYFHVDINSIKVI